MSHLAGFALLLAAAAPPPPAKPTIGSADAPIGAEAVVPFYAQDGAVDYRIDGTRGIWLLANNGRWYYLHVQPDCPRLAQSQSFGIDAGPQGQLDRYSILTVGGDRCLLTSVTRSGPPPYYNQPHHRHD